MENNFKINEQPLKGKPIIGLISSVLALFIGFSAVAFFGAAAPVIKEGMGLTPSQVGLLVAVPTLTGSLLRIPAGAWADSNGGKKPVLILLCLSLAGLGAFAAIAILYPSGDIPHDFYPVMLLCGCFTGCGIGIFTSGIAHVSYWYKENRQGAALGIYGGVGGLSSGIVTALVPFALAGGVYGFRNVYVAWFFIVLAGTVVYYIISNNAFYFQLLKNGLPQDKAKKLASQEGEEEFPEGEGFRCFAAAAKNGKCWALTAIYFSTFGGSLALTSWLPTFWTAHYGLPLTYAGVLTGASSAFSPFMRIFGGRLADRFGGERVSLWALGLCFLGGTILALGSTVFLSVLGVFMTTGGIGLSNGSVFKLVPLYVRGAVGGASGIIGGVGGLGGFVIPPLLGLAVTVMGNKGYSLGFLLYSGLFIICIIIMTVLNRKKMA